MPSLGVLVSLRKLVCLGLLVLAACGGDPATGDQLEETADAAAELADADALDAAGDAGAGRAADGAAPAFDGRAASPSDAAAHPDATAEDGGHPCMPGLYADADADGFFAVVRAPACPGETLPELDCYDENRDAHPGQTGRFATDRGDGSFDYDCDGKETGNYMAVAVCPDVSSWTCPPPQYQSPSAQCDYNTQLNPYKVAAEGWARKVPKCGKRDGFGLNLTWDNATKTFSCFASPDNGPMYENTMLQVCN